jgi:hypothetical protein
MRCSIAELNQMPRMVSPNHQPILDDAERAMDNDFHEDKKRQK